MNGNSDRPSSRVRLAQRTPPLTRRATWEHVVMVVQVDADVDEAEQVAQQARTRGADDVVEALPLGTFSSSTMIVMMMARTPSLNASNRLVRMAPILIGRDRPCAPASLVIRSREFRG